VRRFLSASHSRDASRDLLARRGESLAVSPAVPAASDWPTSPKRRPRAGFQGEPRCSVAAPQKPGVSSDLSRSNRALDDRPVTSLLIAASSRRAPTYRRSIRHESSHGTRLAIAPVPRAVRVPWLWSATQRFPADAKPLKCLAAQSPVAIVPYRREPATAGSGQQTMCGWRWASGSSDTEVRLGASSPPSPRCQNSTVPGSVGSRPARLPGSEARVAQDDGPWAEAKLWKWATWWIPR